MSRNRYEFIVRKILLGEIDDNTEPLRFQQDNRSRSLQPIQLSGGNPLSLIAHPLDKPSLLHETSAGCSNNVLAKTPCVNVQARPDLPQKPPPFEHDAAIDTVQVQSSDPSRTDTGAVLSVRQTHKHTQTHT